MRWSSASRCCCRISGWCRRRRRRARSSTQRLRGRAASEAGTAGRRRRSMERRWAPRFADGAMRAVITSSASDLVRSEAIGSPRAGRRDRQARGGRGAGAGELRQGAGDAGRQTRSARRRATCSWRRRGRRAVRGPRADEIGFGLEATLDLEIPRATSSIGSCASTLMERLTSRRPRWAAGCTRR